MIFSSKDKLPRDAWLISSTMKRIEATRWNTGEHELYQWLSLHLEVLPGSVVVSLACSSLKQHLGRNSDALVALFDVSLIPLAWHWLTCAKFSLLKPTKTIISSKPDYLAYQALVYWGRVVRVADSTSSQLPSDLVHLFSALVTDRRTQVSFRRETSYSYFLLQTLSLIDDFLSSSCSHRIIIVGIRGSTFSSRFVLVAFVVILLLVVVLIEIRIDEIFFRVFRMVIIVFFFLKRSSSRSDSQRNMNTVSRRQNHHRQFRRIHLPDRPAGRAIASNDFQLFGDVRVQWQKTSVIDP